MIKKSIKWILIVLGILVLGLVAAGWMLNKPIPEGKPGPEAEVLAQKMLNAIQKEEWDSTGAIQWTFKSLHTFLWDRQENLVQVEWGETKVLLRIWDQSGRAWKADVELEGEDLKKALEKAWSYFCNDSFWLNAPAKVMDQGTKRSIVDLDNGQKGLMVQYTQGGVTPGDTYLWILDEQGLPQSWQMWTSIIPIGGVELSWESWTSLPTGAKIAQLHKGKLFDLDISNLNAATSVEELGLTEDPFASIR
ncbi:MAG: hypothetical protein DHS20C18_10280 [Saprospiraceae bacterium]|nr:MAG: hypothetical protein DHS20C18_10280 [Saprospiraceae bacterium]